MLAPLNDVKQKNEARTKREDFLLPSRFNGEDNQTYEVDFYLLTPFRGKTTIRMNGAVDVKCCIIEVELITSDDKRTTADETREQHWKVLTSLQVFRAKNASFFSLLEQAASRHSQPLAQLHLTRDGCRKIISSNT